MDCSLPGSSVRADSPGENTGVGCHALLQGIFPTQGSNPDLPHCSQILYHLSHQGSPGPHVVQGTEALVAAQLLSLCTATREASEPQQRSRMPQTNLTQPNILKKEQVEECVWTRQWQPTPVSLPGKSHGWRSLVGCSPCDPTESDTAEVTSAAAEECVRCV